LKFNGVAGTKPGCSQIEEAHKSDLDKLPS